MAILVTDQHTKKTPQRNMQYSHSSVHREGLQNKGFMHVFCDSKFSPYTEQHCGSCFVYHLLGKAVTYTRCSRHIAESHKRVQKVVSDKRVNGNSAMHSDCITIVEPALWGKTTKSLGDITMAAKKAKKAVKKVAKKAKKAKKK
jgi:hypothetical protein